MQTYGADNRNAASGAHTPASRSSGHDSQTTHSEAEPVFDLTRVDNVDSLKFTTRKAAKDYYDAYAHETGFGVRINYQQKKNTRNVTHALVEEDGSTRRFYVSYVCTREGFRKKKENEKKRDIPEVRVGCEAEIRLRWDKVLRKYCVTNWVKTHAPHKLVPRQYKHLHRSARKVSKANARLAMVHKYAGVSIRDSYDIMRQTAGGAQHVGFNVKDLYNYMGSETAKMKKVDESMMQEHFRMRARSDKNFYYEMQADSNGEILSVFWADGRMREEYKVFGDSISFDTTYRTNKEYRPLAIFVGYNHHRELVIFGSALLFDEKTETFEWLFNQFKECMRGQKPTSIFTDQAPAIAAGIRTQFPLPETFHGLCTFHIHQNASKNLGSLCDSAFVAELNYLMFGVDDDIEFEENWEKMKATCFPGKGPEGHPWLTQIYTKKRQWSRAWVQYHFTCGMRSSQLSESCNSNLRHYLKPSLTLIEFFNQFIRLVENKREKQLQRDFQMISGAYPNRFEDSLLTQQLAKVYTPLVFKRWIEEYAPTMGYSMVLLGRNEGGTRMFKVFKRLVDGKTTDDRVVELSADGNTMTCKCHMYEMEGLLCRHIIRMRELLGNVENEAFLKVNETLLLKRYSRTALDGLDLGPTIPEVSQPDVAKYDEMNAALSVLRAQVNGDPYLMDIVIKATKDLSLKLGHGQEDPTPTPPQSQNGSSRTLKKRTDTFKPRKRPMSLREKASHSQTVRSTKQSAMDKHRMGGSDLHL